MNNPRVVGTGGVNNQDIRVTQVQRQPSAVVPSSSSGSMYNSNIRQVPIAPPLPPRAKPLPVGWMRILDPETNQFYYFNESRNTVQWESPRS